MVKCGSGTQRPLYTKANSGKSSALFTHETLATSQFMMVQLLGKGGSLCVCHVAVDRD